MEALTETPTSSVRLPVRRGGLAVAAMALALTAPLSLHAASPADVKETLEAVCLQPQSTARASPYPLRLAGPMPSGGALFFGLMAADRSPTLMEIMKTPLQPPGNGEPKARDVVMLADAANRAALGGDYEAAQKSLGECSAAAERLGLFEGDAVCSGNLGVVLAMQGQTAEARRQFERSQQRYLDWAAELERMATEPPRPQMPRQRNDRRKLLEMGPRVAAAGQIRALLNMGNLAGFVGQIQRAEGDFKRAAEIPIPVPSPADCGAAVASALAHLARRTGRDDAVAAASAGDDADRAASPYLMFLEPGVLSLGAIGSSAATAATAGRRTLPLFDDPRWRLLGFGLGERSDPLRADRSPLAQPDALGRRSDDALQQLADAAQEHERARRRDAAIAAYATLAWRAAAARRTETEAAAQASLLRLYADAGQSAAAIFHGKRAVNLAQQVRVGLADGAQERAAQRNYLRERRLVYTRLAQLLLDQRRLAEAEQVLQLLKEDEGRQFELDRVASRHASIRFGPAEAQAQERFEQALQALRQADEARSKVASGLGANQAAARMLQAATRDFDRSRIEHERVRAAPGLVATLDGFAQNSRRDVDRIADAMITPQAAALIERLAHLIEDAPRFTTLSVPAADLAQWSAALERSRADEAARAKARPRAADAASAPQLQMNPQWQAMATVYEQLAARGALSPPEDPLERMWRADEAMRAVEDRQRRDELDLPRLLAGASAAVPADDDSTRLLARQAPRTALLYYLPDDERLDILLVTSGGRRAWRLAVPRERLDRQLKQFDALLRDFRSNPLPAAQALYGQLLAPVSGALDEAGAQTLVLSLSGTLRYLPFAALHDGRQWVAERFAVAVHPGARLADVMQPSSRHWRVGAFGASGGGADLPGVKRELASIVRSADGSSGAMPGRVWLDDAFTAQALREALDGSSQVIHIASHFIFFGGDADRSHLLLGNGAKISLRELASPDYRFDKVELVTLSACETGRSEADGYGQEVDGLGALLMGQGAASVLASMWKVDDASTALLMAALYRLHEDETLGLTRAEALQRAQIALIRSAAQEQGTRGRGVTRLDLEPDPEAAPPGRDLGGAHPYHWAPFVLLGGWR